VQRDLVRNALRMRPDRIIVGECRGGEAFDMLQAMNTGHDGSLTTIHANSPRDALSRIENMVLMAVELPITAIREQIASGINLLVHLSRLQDGSHELDRHHQGGDARRQSDRGHRQAQRDPRGGGGRLGILAHPSASSRIVAVNG